MGQDDPLAVFATQIQRRQHVQAVVDHRLVVLVRRLTNERLVAALVQGSIPRVEVRGEVLARVLLQVEAEDPQPQWNLDRLGETVVPDGHRPLVQARRGVVGDVDRQPVPLALARRRTVHGDAFQ